jgi:glycosyltransferase involved in cell wall biosynthesis
MRVGFHYHSEAIERADGAVLLPPYLGVFVDALAQHYEQIVAFLHTSTDRSSQCTYACKARNVEFSLLPPRRPPIQRLFHVEEYLGSILQQRDAIDALIMRVPTPLAYYVWQALGRPPTGLLVVGDLVRSGLRVSLPPHKKAVALFFAVANRWQLLRVARHAVVATNGPELAARWQQQVGSVLEAATGTLHRADLRQRDDHFGRLPWRLLFVGRDSREKAVEDLIEAAAHIAGAGTPVQVDIAGIRADSPYGQDLAKVAMAQGLGDVVTFHGFVRFKPELLQLYDQADVMVLPTRWEGVPRTLWEAMGRGCLVVATPVGGIPLVTQHERECLHVPVGRSDLIAEAVCRLEADPQLRHSLIHNGLQQAERHTVDRTVAALVDAFGSANRGLLPDNSIERFS